jgi:hypothetical protein
MQRPVTKTKRQCQKVPGQKLLKLKVVGSLFSFLGNLQYVKELQLPMTITIHNWTNIYVGKQSRIQLRILLNKNDSVIDVYSTLGHLFILHVNKENSTGINGTEVKPAGTRHLQTQVNNMTQSTTWSISIGINVGKVGTENTFVYTYNIYLLSFWQFI